MALSVFLIAAVAAADQMTKAFVLKAIPQGASVSLLGGVLHITQVGNTGSAFRVFQTGTVPMVVTGVLAACWAGAALLRKRLRIGGGLQVGASLILGGAIGNLLDRVRVGHVIDFIDLRFWPVFNLADAAITVGAVVVVCAVMRGKSGGRSSE